MGGRTLYDKLWDAHLAAEREDGSALLYIDRHLLHEVTSPQAFEGLRLADAAPGVLMRTWPPRITTCQPPIGPRVSTVLPIPFRGFRWKR